MDDVVMVASYKLGDQQSERNAVRRIEQLKYHDSMELERTDDDTAEWQRYLEGEQGCDIHLVLTNIHVYIHQKCIYTYIHIHIHQDLVFWQLQPLQT